MRYRRSGSGGTIVLLSRDSVGPDAWPELEETLAAYFRVIVPELPAGTAGLAEWVVDLIDGLGLTRVGLVAAGDLCSAARALAAADDDRIGSAVLFSDGSDSGLQLVDPHGWMGRASSASVLILPAALSAVDAVGRAARFLLRSAGESASS
jgi:pimeloyl-ACP methyl ester carboxylesterase